MCRARNSPHQRKLQQKTKKMKKNEKKQRIFGFWNCSMSWNISTTWRIIFYNNPYGPTSRGRNCHSVILTLWKIGGFVHGRSGRSSSTTWQINSSVDTSACPGGVLSTCAIKLNPMLEKTSSKASHICKITAQTELLWKLMRIPRVVSSAVRLS